MKCRLTKCRCVLLSRGGFEWRLAVGANPSHVRVDKGTICCDNDSANALEAH